MDYYGKRVLALPFGEYYNVFNKIFTEGKNKWDWDIHMVAISQYLKPYSAFIDSHDSLSVFPDFSQKQPWESDPEQVKEICELMEVSERKARIPLSRLLLSCERDIGRAYSKNTYYWAELNITKKILKNKEEIDAILLRAFKFARDTIKSFKPDFCLGAPAIGVLSGVFYYVAQYYEIPYVSCIYSMAISERHFWTREWGAFNSDVNSAFQEKLQSFSAPSEKSLNHIKKFRERPEPLSFYKATWSDKKTEVTFFNANKFAFQSLAHRVIPLLKGERVVNPKAFFQIMIDCYRGYFLKKFQGKLYSSFSDKELSDINYIYYPMHQDPEFVLNVQAPFWYNQLNTIRMLSYNLPTGYKLLVREHRHNVGRRSGKYLRELARYPGVVIVDAFEDQYKYINNANLIVTVNGSTGLEGLFLKKKVMTLDRTAYDALGFSFKVGDVSNFGALLLDAIESSELPEDYDRKVALFLDVERELSLPDDASPELEMSRIQKIINKKNVEVLDEVY